MVIEDRRRTMRRQTKAATSHRQPGKHRKVPIWLIAALVVAITVCGAGFAVQAVQTHKAQVAAAEAKAERKNNLENGSAVSWSARSTDALG